MYWNGKQKTKKANPEIPARLIKSPGGGRGKKLKINRVTSGASAIKDNGMVHREEYPASPETAR